MDTAELWPLVNQLVDEVVQIGQQLGLPYVAAQSDLGDPEPMADADGRAYAETRLRWMAHAEPYWRDRRHALDSPFLQAARLSAEPLYYQHGELRGWRPTTLLGAVDVSQATTRGGIGGAVLAPVHMPGGRVGAIVWATNNPIDMAPLFAAHSEHLFALAVRTLSTHAEASRRRTNVPHIEMLTRREVQCLRWGAAGKTNAEIGIILSMSVSTVRFHLRNAATKLGASSRAQAIQIAAGHGFVGHRQ